MTDFLLAESAIRRLYGLYADALWRKDTEAFAACFARDATWKIAGLTIHGRDEIAAQFANFLSGSEKVAMFLGMPVLDIGGDTATGRVQVTEYVKLKDGRAIQTLGIYYDRFLRDNESWLFQWRHFNLYHYGPPDFSEPYYECPEYGPPPGMPGPDDPTTMRKSG